MKPLKSIIVIIGAIILFSPIISAQKEYKPMTDSDGIEFSYKWKHSKVFKKDSPLMLLLKISNTNDFHADVTFTVDYFWQGIRNASSEPNQVCVKSGKTAKGRLKKLTFDRAKFSDSDILGENFTLDVSDIKTNPVSRCIKK